MSRQKGTNKDGKVFSFETRKTVWNKGKIITDEDPTKKRKDSCGAVIRWDHYGETNYSTGWEIDHKKPVSKGGNDDLDNLQPLQWENNRHKSDNWPQWYCLNP